MPRTRTTRHKRGRPAPTAASAGFTADQVRDAFAAARIQEEATSHAQAPEACIHSLFGSIDDGGRLVDIKRQQYARGKALLDGAELVVSEAVIPKTDDARRVRDQLTRNGHAVISVFASEDTVRLVTLEPKSVQPVNPRE